jgi:hypothetical protein
MEKEEPMRLVALLAVGLFLVGCSSTPQRIEISAKPIEKPKLILPDPAELRLKELQLIVITRDNAEEVFAQLEKDKLDPVLIGMSDEGYEVLALNYSDIMAFIQQQNAIIAAYKNYYEQSEQALEDANQQIDETNNAIESKNAEEPSTLGKLKFW